MKKFDAKIIKQATLFAKKHDLNMSLLSICDRIASEFVIVYLQLVINERDVYVRLGQN